MFLFYFCMVDPITETKYLNLENNKHKSDFQVQLVMIKSIPV